MKGFALRLVLKQAQENSEMAYCVECKSRNSRFDLVYILSSQLQVGKQKFIAVCQICDLEILSWDCAEFNSYMLCIQPTGQLPTINTRPSHNRNFHPLKSLHTNNSPFHGQFFSLALQCNPTWMRVNFRLKLQNSPKLPHIHAKFHCNANVQS